MGISPSPDNLISYKHAGDQSVKQEFLPALAARGLDQTLS